MCGVAAREPTVHAHGIKTFPALLWTRGADCFAGSGVKGRDLVPSDERGCGVLIIHGRITALSRVRLVNKPSLITLAFDAVDLGGDQRPGLHQIVEPVTRWRHLHVVGLLLALVPVIEPTSR